MNRVQFSIWETLAWTLWFAESCHYRSAQEKGTTESLGIQHVLYRGQQVWHTKPNLHFKEELILCYGHLHTALLTLSHHSPVGWQWTNHEINTVLSFINNSKYMLALIALFLFWNNLIHPFPVDFQQKKESGIPGANGVDFFTAFLKKLWALYCKSKTEYALIKKLQTQNSQFWRLSVHWRIKG